MPEFAKSKAPSNTSIKKIVSVFKKTVSDLNVQYLYNEKIL